MKIKFFLSQKRMQIKKKKKTFADIYKYIYFFNISKCLFQIK